MELDEAIKVANAFAASDADDLTHLAPNVFERVQVACLALVAAAEAERWRPIEEELPPIGEPILLSYERDGRKRVKCVQLLIRHEGAVVSMDNIGWDSVQWWFDAPRGNDTTLPKPGMKWRPLPPAPEA